jgi:hypothetical protein
VILSFPFDKMVTRHWNRYAIRQDVETQHDYIHDIERNAVAALKSVVAGILMAMILNWRNDKQGYWMNGMLRAFADIPSVLFVFVPGLFPRWPGLVGPLLWLVAFIFTTVACFSADPRAAAGAPV